MIPEPFRDAVWNAKLDADLNYRYWDKMSRRYFNRERIITIFVAVASSSAVATWGIWKNIDAIWQIFSGVAAILAIVNPILNLQKTIQTMSLLRSNWHNIFYQYDKMWLNIESKTIIFDDLKREFDSLRNHEAEIDSPTATLPVNKRIKELCYNEVLNTISNY